MRQAEVIKRTGANRDELRYFELKGFISPNKKTLKKRVVRDYTDFEVQLISLIIKYRREQFLLDAAYEKAIRELKQPRLI